MNRKCIIKCFEKGMTMREIGEKCGCSHSTVIRFLKKNYPSDKYEMINSSKKKKYTTRKYKLWNAKVCRYYNSNNRFEIEKCFKLYYKNEYVPVGWFTDFVTVEIISDLINEFEK